MTPFFTMVQSSAPNFTSEMIFLNHQFHIILKRRNLEICKRSSFLNCWRNCLLNQTWSSDISKIVYFHYYLTITAMMGFKHLQLISMKTQILNFTFVQKLQNREIFTFLGFQMIWRSPYRRNIWRVKFGNRSLDPSKNDVFAIFPQIFFLKNSSKFYFYLKWKVMQKIYFLIEFFQLLT